VTPAKNLVTGIHVVPSGDYSVIPQALKPLPNFVDWRYETRGGKQTKVPYDPKSPEKCAKANDSSTWASFEQAVEVANPFSDFDFSGIGFELYGTPFVGVDFDGVIKDGRVEPYVLAILELLGKPYTEITPSGNGLRCFVECAKLPPGNRKFSSDKYGAEIYAGNEGGRYLTLTGDRYSGDGIPKIDDIGLPYFLISRIRDDKFKRMWTGDASDYENDDSRLDLALLGYLFRQLNGDTEKAKRFFSASVPGHREKWTSREDYRKRTLEKVLADCKKSAPTAAASPQPVTTQIKLMTETADKIKMRRVRWLWPNRIAVKLNLIVGNPDEGKSLTTEYIVACVTTGRDWFDGKNLNSPSEALMFCGEDDWDDTICPRLVAAGCDLSKVHRPKFAVFTDGQEDQPPEERAMRLDQDIKMIEEWLSEHPNVRLIIVDPISSYLGSADMWKEQSIRADVLTPLKELAERRDVAVLAVMHLNKKVDLEAIHRVGGAVAFVGVARMVWLCAPKPAVELPDGTSEPSDEFVMVKVKGNIVHHKLGGLSYTLKTRPVEIDGRNEFIPYVEFTGEVSQSAAELSESTKAKHSREPHRPDDRKQEAIQWLEQQLKGGDRPLSELQEDGEAAHGYNRELLRCAREEGGIVTYPHKTLKDRRGHRVQMCRLTNEVLGHLKVQDAEETMF
jgi:hypothetical protein